jgi:uncharacterized protein (DUF433 family)
VPQAPDVAIADVAYSSNLKVSTTGAGYITIQPDKGGGKPCVRGLRITVYEVLDYLASDITEEEILADFPDLTPENIRACIACAADRERKLFAAA